MKRIQKGRIYERSGSYFVQYWTKEIIDGELKRVQRSKWLCDQDDEHCEAKTKSGYTPALELIRDEVMLSINKNPNRNQTKTKVADFWTETYLPFVEKNLRHSTVRGYKNIWKSDLMNHFGSTCLHEYETHMGSLFLTSLTGKYGRRTLAHVRSLCSSIFSHACNVGKIDSNPWRDVKILGKVRAPEPTAHYTLDEVKKIIIALDGHVEAQLVVALSSFMGLRPGEIEGLCWSDIDNEYIHVRRASVHGKIGEPKTHEAIRSLPLIKPVRALLSLHGNNELSKQTGEQSGEKKLMGWVFKSEAGSPLGMQNLQNRILRPTLKEAGIVWRGLYAGRRAAGTILTKLTGNAVAAQQILGHKNLSTTTLAYVKQIPSAGIDGMKLLEAAAIEAQQ